MSNDRKDGSQGMDPQNDKALWQLLGRARNVEVGPYFSRRVLREAALAGENRRGVGNWLAGLGRLLRRPRAAVWPGAVVVAGFWLAVVVTTPPSGESGVSYRPWQTAPAVSTASDGVAVMNDESVPVAEDVAPQDVEVIADLDNVIAREENRLWTEDTARF